MHLADFERGGNGKYPRYVARVSDPGGLEEFEVRIAGPAKVVERMFGEATIDLTIEEVKDDSPTRREFEEARKEFRGSMWELAALEDIDALLKPKAPPPDRDSSVFVSARPVSGEGTPFILSASGFFVPTLARVFFFGLWTLSAFASLRPATGDQDLFLHLFSTTGPVVSSGRAGGTAVDVVAFSAVVFPFVPVFDVFGFAAGTCATFTAVGI